MESPYKHICKNRTNIDSIKSDRIKFIATSPSLNFRIKLFILLQSPDIESLFGITKEELQEYKSNFFNIDPLVSSGKIYVIDYLETTRQKDLLDMYLKGEEYCRAKLGLSDKINKETVYGKIIDKTLIESLDSNDTDLKLRTIRSIKIEPKIETAIDKLSELYKDVDL